MSHMCNIILPKKNHIFVIFCFQKENFIYNIMHKLIWRLLCLSSFFFSNSCMLSRMNEWLEINWSQEKVKCIMIKILRTLNMTLLSLKIQFCTLNKHGDILTSRSSICKFIISILIYCPKFSLQHQQSHVYIFRIFIIVYLTFSD